MNDEELNNEMIERYLRKEMTDDERIDFEKKITHDAELKEQITIYKALYSIEDTNDEWFETEENTELLEKEVALFRSKETVQFKENLKKFRDSNSKKKNNIFNLRLLSTVAAVLIIAIFILYPKDVNLSSLYEEYHNWEELPSYISKGETDKDTYKKLESLFLNKEYQTVISQANQIDPTVFEIDQQASLFIGVAHLELDQYEEALQIFDQLITSNSLNAHKGYWYKAMVYLKQGDKEKAIDMLTIISNNTSYYKHDIAKELLRKVD